MTHLSGALSMPPDYLIKDASKSSQYIRMIKYSVVVAGWCRVAGEAADAPQLFSRDGIS